MDSNVNPVQGFLLTVWSFAVASALTDVQNLERHAGDVHPGDDPLYLVPFERNLVLNTPPKMFYSIKEPSTLDKPWLLSKNGDTPPIAAIPVDVVTTLKNYHLMAVEFLYHNYHRKFKGSILNEEPNMNFPLQVAAFFAALSQIDYQILIVCNERNMSYWRYHLVTHGGFKTVTKVIKSVSTSEADRSAFLVLNSDLKLLEDDFLKTLFSVVIEDLDQVANKMIVKRLQGRFNIGLSHRNFYTDPDQKLQWQMLNWCNPGCVGKLNDFYRIDNDNFANFRNNYRFWWLRLTWKFCDTFRPPSRSETDLYESAVENFAGHTVKKTPNKPIRKRRASAPKPKTTQGDDSSSCSEPQAKVHCISPSSSSSDTIIVPLEKYVKLPSMDEVPIVSSIIRNLEKSPRPVRAYSPPPDYFYSEQSHNDNSVIFSILDLPGTSKTSDSEAFIVDLIRHNESDFDPTLSSGSDEIAPSQSEEKGITRKLSDRDIDDVMKQADALLEI